MSPDTPSRETSPSPSSPNTNLETEPQMHETSATSTTYGVELSHHMSGINKLFQDLEQSSIEKQNALNENKRLKEELAEVKKQLSNAQEKIRTLQDDNERSNTELTAATKRFESFEENLQTVSKRLNDPQEKLQTLQDENSCPNTELAVVTKQSMDYREKFQTLQDDYINQGQARPLMTMQEVCETMEKVQSYLIDNIDRFASTQATVENMEKRLLAMDIKLQASETARNAFDDIKEQASKEQMVEDQMKVQAKIEEIEKRLVDMDSDIKRQASETVHKVEDVKELVVDLI
ncbi:hypothetical protein FPQ18DRAFT_385218 [Pyronema domesticum]|nr:hypothetical protein FPQ18DRAFT_385218 [Pyronema domesticum]